MVELNGIILKEGFIKKIRDATMNIINTETSHIACMQRYVGQV